MSKDPSRPFTIHNSYVRCYLQKLKSSSLILTLAQLTHAQTRTTVTDDRARRKKERMKVRCNKEQIVWERPPRTKQARNTYALSTYKETGCDVQLDEKVLNLPFFVIFTSVGTTRGQGIIRVVVATFFGHSHFLEDF